MINGRQPFHLFLLHGQDGSSRKGRKPTMDSWMQTHQMEPSIKCISNYCFPTTFFRPSTPPPEISFLVAKSLLVTILNCDLTSVV
ncbi:unnamed protein product [Thelazia callipaeda]|uniref:Ovule protein n=1 Tax=Thelazia callipaeda TaxID=103827 RepID=A0A0N5CK45_THECL|nr:unnamed protein product [Thelazia callipaeda]